MGPPRKGSSIPLSQSSNTGDEDQRFVELLKPIKDLTVNWSVPLAKYLEDYYEELTELHINLDGRTTKVNFAEAALFLQGTASVYSKKVEFLWQNVLKMLDLLSSKKALEEAAEGPDDDEGTATGRKRRKVGPDLNDFSLVSIEVHRNTDLKTPSGPSSVCATPSVHARKMTLKFIFVTPRQLIEKESKEQNKTTRINMYIKAGNAKYDLLGQKEDFRVNSQFAMGTAMIGEELKANSDLGQLSVSLCDSSTADESQAPVEAVSGVVEVASGATEAPSGAIKVASGAAEEDVAGNPAVEADVSSAACDFDNVADANDFFEEAPANAAKSRPSNAATAADKEEKAPLAEPWEVVKPPEADRTIAKPIRKGRRRADKVKKSSTRSRPGPGSEGESSSGMGLLKVAVPIHDVLIAELSRGEGLRVACAVPFVDSAGAVKKDRKSGQKPPSSKESGEVEKAAEDNVEEAVADADDGWADFAEPEDFALTSDNDVEEAGKEADERNVNTDSYEDLVMKRVAEYVAQSQDYVESTDLAKRVRCWHDMLRPKLDAVEKRGDFDVHEYGSKIISLFPEKNSADDRPVAPAPMGFVDVAAGCGRDEVARLFLSSLMLANSRNIDIICDKEAGDDLPMDSVSMTLLSTHRHHEQFSQEAGEAGEVFSRQSKKSKKRKNRDDDDDASVVESAKKHVTGVSRKLSNALPNTPKPANRAKKKIV